MKMGLLILSVASLLPALTGCPAGLWVGPTANQPGTTVEVGRYGAKVHATANTRAHADELRVNPATREFYAKNLDVGQTPSEVVAVEPGKIEAIGHVQALQAEYVQQLFSGVTSVIHEVMPLLNILALANVRQVESGLQMTLPNGITLGGKKISTPTALTSYLQNLSASAGQAAQLAQGAAGETNPSSSGTKPPAGVTDPATSETPTSAPSLEERKY